MEKATLFIPELATTQDQESILHLYQRATEQLKSNGIIQWNEEYPSAVTLRQNLEQGATWVIRDEGKPIATITMDEEQDPQYENIQWAFPSQKTLVVHRLCVSPDYQQRGLARLLMQFAESFAARHQFQVIRLDAFLGNPYSQRLYKSLGYHEPAGYCYYSPGAIMCNCFEKRVG